MIEDAGFAAEKSAFNRIAVIDAVVLNNCIALLADRCKAHFRRGRIGLFMNKV